MAIGIGLFVVQAILGCGPGAPAPDSDVLLLVVDALRSDHLGVYGYSRPTSPSLDRFAASSTVFADVFAPASWTRPSVASMMTGVYPSVHGMHADRSATEMGSLRQGLETLSQAFRDRGYRTLAVVTNPWIRGRKRGLRRGFHGYRYLESADADVVHRFAREMLEQGDARPTFLYLHYMDVHAPYARPLPGDPELGPAPEWYRRTLEAEELGSVPSYSRLPGAKRLDEYVDAYDQGIRRWDRSFGEFIGWLRGTGRLDRTVVAVVADHGEEFLEHGGWDHGLTLYQEQLIVPWILYIPGLQGRRVDGRVASLIDVAPTLLGAVGAKIPSTMAGRDLLSRPGSTRSRTLYSETGVSLGGVPDPARAQLAIRRGSTKLILGPQGHLCFDLQRDPEERSPIAGVAKCGIEVLPEIERWRRDTRRTAEALGEAPIEAIDPKERERLRALGYVD